LDGGGVLAMVGRRAPSKEMPDPFYGDLSVKTSLTFRRLPGRVVGGSGRGLEHLLSVGPAARTKCHIRASVGWTRLLWRPIL